MWLLQQSSPLVPRGRLNWEKVCGHWSCRLVTEETAMLKADGIFWKLKAIANIWRLCVCVPSVGHQPWVWERCVLMVEVGAERKVTLPPVSQTQRADSPVPRKQGPQLGRWNSRIEIVNLTLHDRSLSYPFSSLLIVFSDLIPQPFLQRCGQKVGGARLFL